MENLIPPWTKIDIRNLLLFVNSSVRDRTVSSISKRKRGTRGAKLSERTRETSASICPIINVQTQFLGNSKLLPCKFHRKGSIAGYFSGTVRLHVSSVLCIPREQKLHYRARENRGG